MVQVQVSWKSAFLSKIFLPFFFIGNFGLVFGHIFTSLLWLSVISRLGNRCWLVHDHLLRHLDSHCCYYKNS